MKAYEFPAKVTGDGRLEFSEAILNKLPANREVRVIVLVSEPADTAEYDGEEDEREEKTPWVRLAAEQFFADSSVPDTIYDEI